VLVVWELDGGPVGFSTADKIVYGEHANMHLHVIDARHRLSGIGARCVPLTVDLYFDRLKYPCALAECFATRVQQPQWADQISVRQGECRRPRGRLRPSA
jgi:hypothetical protein